MASCVATPPGGVLGVVSCSPVGGEESTLLVGVENGADELDPSKRQEVGFLVIDY